MSSLLPAPKKRKEAEAAKPKPRVLGGAYAGPTPEVVMHEDDDAEVEGTEGAVEKKPTPVATAPANTMFIPQSVARKPIQPMSAFRRKGVQKSSSTASIPKPKTAPTRLKVSLFGSAPVAKPVAQAATGGEYKPIMLETLKPEKPIDRPEETYEEPPPQPEEEQINDIQTLAQDVGLDDAAVILLFFTSLKRSRLTSIAPTNVRPPRSPHGTRHRGSAPAVLDTEGSRDFALPRA